MLLRYDSGLDKYHGLIELACDAGIFEKAGSRIKANGKSVYAKQIMADPKAYFTDDVMERLEEVVRDYFKYGNENRTDDTQESDSE